MSDIDRQVIEQSEQPEQPEQEPRLSLKERFRRSVLEWAETIVMAIVLVAVLFTFVVRIITVDGSSMKPTYFHGDRVLVTDLAGEVKRGDIVIVINALREPIIKRVIATEGEMVDFDPYAGEVVVDGNILSGSYFGIADGITYLPELPGQVLKFPQTVPEGCVFVMGDNRGNSTDSRYTEVGMVDRRNILGKVIFNVYPFSKLGAVK